MRIGSIGWSLLFVGSLHGVSACGSGAAECTCAVDNNGERRTLVCGVSACVGGSTIICSDQDRTALRGACTSAPPATTGSPSATPTTTPPEPDLSCDDLQAFCSTSCRSPASASTDCQSTASAGDPGACAAWQLGSGLLCRP